MTDAAQPQSPGEPPVIECEKFVAHPPAAVWRALTDPGMMARWLAPGDVRPVVGHRFGLDMGQWGMQKCEVVAVEPERLFAYRFAEGVLDTTITWRLVPEGRGTRLFVRHAGFDLDSPIGRQAYEGMGEGWPHVVEAVGRVLDEDGAAGAGTEVAEAK